MPTAARKALVVGSSSAPAPRWRLPPLLFVPSLVVLLSPATMWKSVVSVRAAAAATERLSSTGNQWLPAYWSDVAQQSIDAAVKRQPNTNVAKNLVLVIGDGMGISTSTAARILLGQQQNELGEEEFLAWEKFPHLALSKTYNTDAMTADSAGTATAYHFGFKTKLGVIGLDDRVIRGNCSTEKFASAATSKSLLELAELAGKSTGIVTTARVTHASPAPLYARSADRNWEADSNVPRDFRGDCRDIARQLIENGTNIEVVMGGGRSKFLPANESDPEYPTKKGDRADGRNLLQEWQRKQESLNRRCQYVWNQEGFDQVDSSADCVLALFEPSHMLYEEDKINSTSKEPSLTQMVEKAIQILRKNPKGFYLFIEGGKIDHGHHNSQARYALTEAVEMHRAVSKVKEMTSETDTLVVVSADHSHVFNIVGYPQRGTPIFGLSTNVEEGLVPKDSKPYTVLMYANGPGYAQPRQNLTGLDTTNKSYVYQSGVPLTSETHGGEDVAIYASGPMSHLFYGVQEQSYIPHVMAYASCIGANKQHCSTTNSASGRGTASDTSRAAAFLTFAVATAGMASFITNAGLH